MSWGGRSQVGNQQGMVLLIVLVSIALISSLIYSRVEGQRFQIYRVENELNLQQAQIMARSAIPEVLRVLNQPQEGGGSRVDSLEAAWAQPLEIPWDREQVVEVSIIDVSRWINLNSLMDSSGTLSTVTEQRLQRLLEQQELSIEAVEAVADWIDADSERRGIHGAEKLEYQALGAAYVPTNGPLHTLHELALIKGWDEEMVSLIRPAITANAHCTQAEININTAPPEALLALSDEMNPVVVESILELRESSPFQSVDEMRSELRSEFAELSAQSIPLTTESDCYNVKISATAGKVRGVVKLAIKKNGNNRFVIVE